MELEAYLSAFKRKEPTPEDHFGGGVDVNSAEAILRTHNTDSSLDVFEVDQSTLPLELSLVMTLKGQTLREVMPNYTFEFSSKGSSDGILAIGKIKDSLLRQCCASVSVHWQGEGSQKDEYGVMEDLCPEVYSLFEGLSNQSLIYSKAFNVPPGNSFSFGEIYTKEDKWLYKCSSWLGLREGEHPLFPFGGYFPKNLDLEKMMPMYGCVGGGENTALGVKAQSFWQRSGVYPGQKGQVGNLSYSLVGLKEPYVQTTLAQDVRGGRVQLRNVDLHYVSYDYDVLDPLNKTLLIHFKKG